MGKKNEYSLSSFRALEMQEMDRKRIAMEIHDTTVQNLTTLVHKTEYTTKLLDIDSVRARLELNTMTDILRNSIEELREIIFDLRPMCIDDLGLIAAIERYVNQMQLDNDTLKYFLNVSSEENIKIIPIVNLTIFRIIQEILVNVRKHAHATKVEINLVYESDYLYIVVKDNGIGFDINKDACKVKNFGLSIMKERVKLLAGEINIDSIMGNGTIIQVKVPIVEEDGYDTN